MPTSARPGPARLTCLSLREMLEIEARRLGFAEIGVTDLAPFEEAAARAERAIAEGRMKGMPWYTPERVKQAAELGPRFPWGRSLVALSYPYPPAAAPLQPVPEPAEQRGRPRGRIASYALGEDYHRRLDEALRSLVEQLGRRSPGLRSHRFVDHGRAFDRAIAERAGLGFSGKNTQLISAATGSYVLLASIVLSLELKPDRPSSRSCGHCRACLPSCPTGALVAPGVIDATRCISYLTIEHSGPIPVPLRPLMGSWVFGCDLCQEACPINARLSPAPVPVGPASVAWGAVPFPDLVGLLELTEPAFHSQFASTALERSGRERLARNAAIALGNRRSRQAVPSLAGSLKGDPSAVVRGASAWALGRIGGGKALAALTAAPACEVDPGVLGEIESALAGDPRSAPGVNSGVQIGPHSA